MSSHRSIGAFLLALAFVYGHGCDGEAPYGSPEIPPGPPPSTSGDIRPIIHTADGSHLAFRADDFEPQAVEHCREDGSRRLTTIFELSRIVPLATRTSFCSGFAGEYLGLQLSFPDEPALKVTTMCRDGCVTPGGYYPPLGRTVRVPWDEITQIELRRVDR